jgi:hypothetical protein
MATAPFATPVDLAAWVGQSIASNDARALAVLAAASSVITAEVGSDVVEEWETVPDDVAAVTVQVAARVWFNPQGLVADAIDDYSRRWENGGESGVYLTAGERDLLSKYRTSGPKGLWTLGTTRGDEYADQYLDVTNPDGSTQDEPMPFLPPGE